MSERRRFKVRLTPREAALVLNAVSAVHDDNTDCLSGVTGYRAEGDEREVLKEESAALRRVRDALRRQFGRND